MPKSVCCHCCVCAPQSVELAMKTFPDPTKLYVSDIQRNYTMLRMQLSSLHQGIVEIIKRILMSSPDARDRLVYFIERLLAANVT